MEFLIGIALRDAGFALSMAGTILLGCGFVGFVFTVVHMLPRRGPALRCCPVCAADAVADHETVDGVEWSSCSSAGSAARGVVKSPRTR